MSPKEAAKQREQLIELVELKRASLEAEEKSLEARKKALSETLAKIGASLTPIGNEASDFAIADMSAVALPALRKRIITKKDEISGQQIELAKRGLELKVTIKKLR